jgi:hypothetical protein
MDVPMKVRRFMGGILLLPGGKGTGIAEKRRAARQLHEKWNPTSCGAEFFSSK